MSQTKPNITATIHTLTFDKLSPRDFERLCVWLVECEGYQRAGHMPALPSALPLLSDHGKIPSGGSRHFRH
jgi:hypothetical protein